LQAITSLAAAFPLQAITSICRYFTLQGIASIRRCLLSAGHHFHPQILALCRPSLPSADTCSLQAITSIRRYLLFADHHFHPQILFLSRASLPSADTFPLQVITSIRRLKNGRSAVTGPLLAYRRNCTVCAEKWDLQNRQLAGKFL
jgi:hypothetical protein